MRDAIAVGPLTQTAYINRMVGSGASRSSNLLGVSEKNGGLHEPLERGISAVHTIVWREMIGEITRVDTDGRRFSAQATLRRAKRRCVERMHAFEQQVANYTLRKEAKGEDPTDGYEGYQKQVQGIPSHTLLTGPIDGKEVQNYGLKSPKYFYG